MFYFNNNVLYAANQNLETIQDEEVQFSSEPREQWDVSNDSNRNTETSSAQMKTHNRTSKHRSKKRQAEIGRTEENITSVKSQTHSRWSSRSAS